MKKKEEEREGREGKRGGLGNKHLPQTKPTISSAPSPGPQKQSSPPVSSISLNEPGRPEQTGTPRPPPPPLLLQHSQSTTSLPGLSPQQPLNPSIHSSPRLVSHLDLQAFAQGASLFGVFFPHFSANSYLFLRTSLDLTSSKQPPLLSRAGLGAPFICSRYRLYLLQPQLSPRRPGVCAVYLALHQLAQ